MTLAPGDRLGSYEVIGLLGRGGMGEVYRARDTRLGRDVAIKVLPASFASNPDRIARFEREAKTLAALNHPNVAAIHGLEDSGGSKALVLELVEGPTLQDRIGTRALSLNDALAIARQIADALEAAHDQGVIHRDLKPANIKVRPDGTVKVLDFGLAKALEGSGQSDPSLSPTLTSPASTMQGVVMGTASYMSPEQAEGADVDQRSDIWSFGVVLYEMLTGSRLFGGDSVQRVLAKVLERDVDLSALPATTPASIRRLLRRCLERDSKRRLHHIADARVEIDEALSGGGEHAATTAVTPTGVARPSYAIWGLGLVVLVLGAVAAFALWRLSRTEPLAVAQFEITTPPDATPRLGGALPDVAISPDGSRVVYASGTNNGSSRLYIRQTNQVEVAPLRGAERATAPFFSPDGQHVGFIDGVEASLKRVSVLGGPPTTIAVIGQPIGGASWGLDDTIVLGGGLGRGLWQVSARGGEPKMLTTLDPKTQVAGHNWPDVLPNGKGVLFTLSGTTAATSRIAVIAFDSGVITELVSGGSQPRYVSTGHIVYAVDGTLRAVAFDQDRLAVIGSPVPVLEGVLTKNQGAALFSVAPSGSLVYLNGSEIAGVRRELVWVDRNGGEKHIAFADANPFWPRLSPDNTRAAFISGNDVWVSDLARGTVSRVSDVGTAQFVFWHPDGRRVLFSAIVDGRRHLLLQSADGTGKPERLPYADARVLSPEGWARDGRIVVSFQSPKSQGWDIGLLSPNGDALQTFLGTPANEDSFTISPDGRWIAYEADRTGQYEVYVERFPEGGDRHAISAPDGGEDPTWAPSGKELFYWRPKDKAMTVVQIQTATRLTSGEPTVLFEHGFFNGGGRNFDIDRNGRRFILFKELPSASGAPAQRLILVQNWIEELKRLVPSKF